MASSEQVLAACPFCGATFETATRDGQPAFWITHYSECYIASTKGNRHQWVLARGIRKWNQRATPPAPAVATGEMIRSAAIRKDGMVYACWAHTYPEIKRMNYDAPDDVFKNCEQGFVTSVSRIRGLIAKLKTRKPWSEPDND